MIRALYFFYNKNNYPKESLWNNTYLKFFLLIFELILIARMVFRFLPQLTKQMLEKTLYSCSIQPISTDINDSSIECKYDSGNLTIGSTTVPRYNTEASSKVPNVLFYDLPQVRITFWQIVILFKFIWLRVTFAFLAFKTTRTYATRFCAGRTSIASRQPRCW